MKSSLDFGRDLCQSARMAKKRTKADKLQQNAERLDTRREAFEIETQHSEPAVNKTDVSMLDEQIRQRAHQLYEERGREDGHDREDWLQAEAEILAGYRQNPAAPGKLSFSRYPTHRGRHNKALA